MIVFAVVEQLHQLRQTALKAVLYAILRENGILVESVPLPKQEYQQNPASIDASQLAKTEIKTNIIIEGSRGPSRVKSGSSFPHFCLTDVQYRLAGALFRCSSNSRGTAEIAKGGCHIPGLMVSFFHVYGW